MSKLKKLIVMLIRERLTVSAAESCSAGYLSYLLTKIPGSSKIFKGSVVVYSLEAKNKFFKIPYSLLNKTQGVSAEIAQSLAQGTRRIFNSHVGVSLVGFAGPESKKGTKVGTVYIAVADKAGIISKKIVIKGGRDTVRKKASLLAIKLLHKKVESSK